MDATTSTLDRPALSPPVVVGAGAAVLAAGALGFVVDPRLGLVALGAPAALIVVTAPAAGVALLLFALPLEELAALAPGGFLTLHKLLGMAVVAGWLLHALLQRQPIRVPSIALVPGAFVLWAAVSALWAVDPAMATHMTLTYVQLVALYLLVVNVLDTPAALRRALHAHVAGAVVLCIFGLYLTGQGILQGGRTAIVVDHELLMEPNGFAAALLVPIAICLAGALDRTRPTWERVAVTLAGTLCVTTVVLTMSRGALLALGAMVIVASVARGQIALLVGAVLLAVPGALLAGPEFWQRLAEGATLADRGAGRLDILHVGSVIVREHPLIGVGLGGFPLVYYEYLAQAAGISWQHALAVAHTLEKAPHNIYLGVTAELGIVGLGLLVAAVAVHLRAALRAWRRLEAAHHPAAALVLAGAMALLAMAVQGAFFDVEHRKSFWLALGLAAIAARRPTAALPAAVPLRSAA
jgi:putative inorganic carbon (HCO3(-)) transporter